MLTLPDAIVSLLVPFATLFTKLGFTHNLEKV